MAYQGDDFHEAPEGEEDSEEHFCGLGVVATRKKLVCDALDICDEILRWWEHWQANRNAISADWLYSHR
jgi:hypothetical protein